MYDELVNIFEKAAREWVQVSILKLVNVNSLRDGDIIVLRSAEPLDKESLSAVRARILTMRPDLNTLAIMSLDLDENIEVVHRTMKEYNGPKQDGEGGL